jgi:hypothetical protein
VKSKGKVSHLQPQISLESCLVSEVGGNGLSSLSPLEFPVLVLPQYSRLFQPLNIGLTKIEQLFAGLQFITGDLRYLFLQSFDLQLKR